MYKANTCHVYCLIKSERLSVIGLGEFHKSCVVYLAAEHDDLRYKMAEEATEELGRQTLLEQQRHEEERLQREELLKQQMLAKGKCLIVCLY